MTDSIIFAGTPENAAQTLRALVEAGIEVELVLTRPDAPAGRKRLLTPSPVALVASELGIETLKINKVDSATIRILSEAQSQIAIVVAFGVLLSKSAIESLDSGWFNLHYSLLPAFRGAAPVQHAILNGECETGVTVFKIDEGLDTGPIVAMARTTINPYETSKRLLSRLTEIGISLLRQEIPKLFSGVELQLSGQTGSATYAPKLTREDARIDFLNSALLECQRIQATNPEPGAWCKLDGENLKIIESRISEHQGLRPGQVQLVNGKVVCGFSGERALEFIEVQPAGKSIMLAADWLRGRKMEVWLQ